MHMGESEGAKEITKHVLFPAVYKTFFVHYKWWIQWDFILSIHCVSLRHEAIFSSNIFQWEVLLCSDLLHSCLNTSKLLNYMLQFFSCKFRFVKYMSVLSVALQIETKLKQFLSNVNAKVVDWWLILCTLKENV